MTVDDIERLVLVVPPGWVEQAFALIAEAAPLRVTPTVVAGGRERQDSVRAGLAAAGDTELIAIHDAARPFVRADVIRAVIHAARAHGAALAALPATDTVKRVHPDGWIESTPPRDRLWLAQTPQVFRAEVIRAAHAAPQADGATDDAQMIERSGARVYVVPGDPENRKITTPEDLRWAEWVLSQRATPR